MLWLRLLLGTGARFASRSRLNLAGGAFVAVLELAVLELADVLAVALVDEAVDELKGGVVSELICDVESVLEVLVEAEIALVGTTPVLGIVTAEAMSVSFSLGFAVSVAFVGKSWTGAGSKFV